MAININELSYPFDPTGKLASNKITDELHVLSAINWRDYNFIVPRLAPFFGTPVLTFRGQDGVTKDLVEGKDYYLTHLFHDASLACATPIYGSISFNDTQLAGVVTIKSYQSLGGIWTLDDAKIAEILAERLRNPRITTWEQVVDMPVSFPVIDHEWNLVDMVGMSHVVTALNGIEAAIRLKSQAGLDAHLNDFNNPHRVTKEQILLGLVRNLSTASIDQAIAGVSDDFYMTPFTVKAAIDASLGVDFRKHLSDFDNPHHVTAAQLGVMSAVDVMAELNKKLGKLEVAADTKLFAGMSDVAFKAWVLEGTAANSVKFGGYSTLEYAELIKQMISAESPAGYSKAEADNLLNQKLDKTGTAVNSERLAGRDSAALKAWILDGTAANSTMFNGMTQAQYTQYLLDQVSTSIGDTYTKPEIDLKLSQKLGVLETAANTFRFGSRDSDTYKAWVLEGTAANSNALAGMTYPTIKADILAGTAYNSDRFNNLTFPQFEDYLDGRFSKGKSQVVLPALPQAPGSIWVCFANAVIKPAGTPFDDDDADTHLLVAGGDAYSGPGSPLLTMRISVRGDSVTPVKLEITSGSSVLSSMEFGVVVSADKRFADIWVKSPRGRNAITFSQMSDSVAVNISEYENTTAEPAGILYFPVTGGSFATTQDLEAVLEVMTQSFNNLAAALT